MNSIRVNYPVLVAIGLAITAVTVFVAMAHALYQANVTMT